MPLYLGKKLVSGAPGKSAYQSAMEAGYDGTEIAFNAALAETPGHIVNKEKPHGVTAKQVGLGNVPNVSTNDQTPTYSEANELSTLTSGEKLSVAFGKIAKAISSFLSHAHRHAAGGEDPLTPGMIGAVNKAGDIMTGNLVISNEIPIVQLGSSKYGCITSLLTSGHEARFEIINGANERILQLFDETGQGNIANALRLVDSFNGNVSAYPVLHTGNKDQIFTYGTADLTTGSSSLETGKLYFVYE